MRNKNKFNLFKILLVLLLLFFLYSQNNQLQDLNKRLTDIENKRLRLIEDKFGGQAKMNCDQSKTVSKISPSVVRIVGGEAEGSGFILNDDGYLVTNFHVIETEPAPRVIFSDNTVEVPEILYADKNSDLAILKVYKRLPAIDWGNSDTVNATDEVLVLGYPFGGNLTGAATVKKGYLSAKRNIHDKELEFLQTDSTLNPGMSGGPMITVCGQFVGINTLGTAGIGLAISSNSFKQKYLEMLASDEPLKDIIRVEFNPNVSPLEAVKAFYNYIKIKKLDKAYELLTDNFLKGGTYKEWIKGYELNLDTSVLKIENDSEKENVVKVKLITKDLIKDEIVYRFFEGWWEVKEIDENLKLWWPDIKEVKDPDFLWFYE